MGESGQTVGLSVGYADGMSVGQSVGFSVGPVAALFWGSGPRLPGDASRYITAHAGNASPSRRTPARGSGQPPWSARHNIEEAAGVPDVGFCVGSTVGGSDGTELQRAATLRNVQNAASARAPSLLWLQGRHRKPRILSLATLERGVAGSCVATRQKTLVLPPISSTCNHCGNIGRPFGGMHGRRKRRYKPQEYIRNKK